MAFSENMNSTLQLKRTKVKFEINFRLKKLKNLDLSDTGITGKSLDSIIEYAKENLVTLNVAHTSKIKVSKFLELKSLTNLKYLCCDGKVEKSKFWRKNCRT